jgi:hypothetical protein
MCKDMILQECVTNDLSQLSTHKDLISIYFYFWLFKIVFFLIKVLLTNDKLIYVYLCLPVVMAKSGDLGSSNKLCSYSCANFNFLESNSKYESLINRFNQ